MPPPPPRLTGPRLPPVSKLSPPDNLLCDVTLNPAPERQFVKRRKGAGGGRHESVREHADEGGRSLWECDRAV